MNDLAGRNIHYLRISLTDRCNLRCRYCMPESGVELLPHDDILRFEEIERIARIMVPLGINRIRLTGGEPLVRKDLPQLAAAIKKIDGVHFLGLTTNGLLLPQLGKAICDAGLDGINISMDTTNPERYHQITRQGSWADAWTGLQTALELPFKSVKINCVLAPGSQPDDWLSVIELAKRLPVDVRLIEWMPMMGEDVSNAPNQNEALSQIEARFGHITPHDKKEKGGPAQYYQLPGFQGLVGFISAISHNFCSQCNRLRLTASGDLKLCLFYDEGISLRPMLRGSASDDEIKEAIQLAVLNKPLRHQGSLKTAEDDIRQDLLTRLAGMFGVGG